MDKFMNHKHIEVIIYVECVEKGDINDHYKRCIANKDTEVTK